MTTDDISALSDEELGLEIDQARARVRDGVSADGNGSRASETTRARLDELSLLQEERATRRCAGCQSQRDARSDDLI